MSMLTTWQSAFQFALVLSWKNTKLLFNLPMLHCFATNLKWVMPFLSFYQYFLKPNTTYSHLKSDNLPNILTVLIRLFISFLSLTSTFWIYLWSVVVFLPCYHLLNVMHHYLMLADKIKVNVFITILCNLFVRLSSWCGFDDWFCLVRPDKIYLDN